MSYFVTGATGFIGRFLVPELLGNRQGEIFVLCRESSLPRMQQLISRWGSERVVPVIGDLGAPDLGVDPEWIAEHGGEVEPFFHTASIYAMTADAPTNHAMTVPAPQHDPPFPRPHDAPPFPQPP